MLPVEPPWADRNAHFELLLVDGFAHFAHFDCLVANIEHPWADRSPWADRNARFELLLVCGFAHFAHFDCLVACIEHPMARRNARFERLLVRGFAHFAHFDCLVACIEHPMARRNARFERLLVRGFAHFAHFDCLVACVEHPSASRNRRFEHLLARGFAHFDCLAVACIPHRLGHSARPSAGNPSPVPTFRVKKRVHYVEKPSQPLLGFPKKNVGVAALRQPEGYAVHLAGNSPSEGSLAHFENPSR
jgi:hypothetical protein